MQCNYIWQKGSQTSQNRGNQANGHRKAFSVLIYVMALSFLWLHVCFGWSDDFHKWPERSRDNITRGEFRLGSSGNPSEMSPDMLMMLLEVNVAAIGWLDRTQEEQALLGKPPQSMSCLNGSKFTSVGNKFIIYFLLLIFEKQMCRLSSLLNKIICTVFLCHNTKNIKNDACGHLIKRRSAAAIML